MKIVYLASIATGSILILGLAMLIPVFSRTPVDNRIPVLLSFEVGGRLEESPEQVSDWCNDLSKLLDRQKTKGIVFVSGVIAESSPECVKAFSSDIDIGSQTYNYSDIVSLRDYAKALEEVREGKKVVDEIGDFESLSFRAPHGSTDENIYSLLSRSGILADFSYSQQYNEYEQDMFIKRELRSFGATSEGLNEFSVLLLSGNTEPESHPIPIMINFDNPLPIPQIHDLISQLKSGRYADKIYFVNASELTGMDLTIRKSETS